MPSANLKRSIRSLQIRGRPSTSLIARRTASGTRTDQRRHSIRSSFKARSSHSPTISQSCRTICAAAKHFLRPRDVQVSSGASTALLGRYKSLLPRRCSTLAMRILKCMSSTRRAEKLRRLSWRRITFWTACLCRDAILADCMTCSPKGKGIQTLRMR